ncbi:Uncharacterised protein [Streptococcus pneumoniae]|nr:Uncharacterised protein [Streptococcus pneumoniae]VKG44480.1 Uncharacterised protein [Streptococcus pneumoniae]
MKHKEHILIGLLYLLSPFIGQLLVEHTHTLSVQNLPALLMLFAGYQLLSASTIFPKMYCLSSKNRLKN